MADGRGCGLSTHDLDILDEACELIYHVFGAPYLVGSAGEGQGYRDVDVRLILRDEEFDRLFARDVARWELLSLALGDYLRRRTGLPVDFQVQRQTEANEKHTGKRNPLGIGHRVFAGGGDGTPKWEAEG